MKKKRQRLVELCKERGLEGSEGEGGKKRRTKRDLARSLIRWVRFLVLSPDQSRAADV